MPVAQSPKTIKGALIWLLTKKTRMIIMLIMGILIILVFALTCTGSITLPGGGKIGKDKLDAEQLKSMQIKSK